MPISKVRKVRQPLRALRLAETHQVGHRLVDVAPPIAFGMLSEMTQNGVVKRGLRRKC
jgi:hypothetical protein